MIENNVTFYIKVKSIFFSYFNLIILREGGGGGEFDMSFRLTMSQIIV